MIEGFKPYQAYKDSGLPWLGECPEHWSTRRMKFLFQERAQKGFPNEPLLAATQTQGVVRKTDYGERTVTAQKDLHLLKLVDEGDFVISLRSFQGGIEVAHCRGIISPAYTVLTPNKEAHRAYFRQFFKSTTFIGSLSLFVTGIREGQNIDYVRLSRVYMPLPPIDEQDAIGRFLDHASARIERAIRAKKKLIALLNEQKQSIVRQAVTCGLDLRAPKKPSGLAWIGKIPKHWEIRKIKFLVSAAGGMTPSKADGRFWGGRMPWVSPKDMKVREIDDSQDHITEAALRATGIAVIHPPAVLIVVRGMILARAFPVALTSSPVTVNQDMKALIPNSMIAADYMVSLLTGIQREILQLVEIAGHGTCCLRTDSWENFKLPVPPLADQAHILEFLKRRLQKVNAAIVRAEGEIGFLGEYRTRLIADVVTGKLDVRGAAERLPIETDGPDDSQGPEEIELFEEQAVE